MLPNLGLIAEARSNDAAAIEKAAERLRVNEFELFRLAHRHWFGDDPGTKALEHVFVAYLFRGEAPMWVRHFSRQALGRDRAPDEPCAPGMFRGVDRRFAALAVAAAFGVILVVSGAGHESPACDTGNPGPAAQHELDRTVDDAGPTPC